MEEKKEKGNFWLTRQILLSISGKLFSGFVCDRLCLLRILYEQNNSKSGYNKVPSGRQ